MLCKSFIGSDDAVSPGISLIIRESSDQSAAAAPWSQAEITQRDSPNPQVCASVLRRSGDVGGHSQY